MNLRLLFLIVFSLPVFLYSQLSRRAQDSLYILSQERDASGLYKNFHAEPLFIDLIRDLGARKGEKEWNVGAGIQDQVTHDEYNFLVEYEWAVANRLGLEIEVPVVFTQPLFGKEPDSLPKSRIEGLKTAVQWSFLVNEKYKTTLALGYINEVLLEGFSDLSQKFLKGNKFNPFFVAAKRFGNRFHTLLYTGPELTYLFNEKKWKTNYDINTSFHYMIHGSRNFIGLEVNKTIEDGKFSMMLRPQMRVAVADNFLVGIVTGIPTNENQRFSTFLRVIYEPGHMHHK